MWILRSNSRDQRAPELCEMNTERQRKNKGERKTPVLQMLGNINNAYVSIKKIELG